MNQPPLKNIVYASLMAALVAVGSFIAIPIGPVPIVLQNMFVLLAGLLLGPAWGAASVAVYLLAGAAGLPVFAGGAGGLGKLFGPTGGYLMGYLPAVALTGWISRLPGSRMVMDAAAMLAGSAVLYACGLAWLKTALNVDWTRALALGFLPFIIGDAVKIAAAALLARTLRPILNQRA